MSTSARELFATAPLGAMIRFSDGLPRPPARFKHKLAAWERRNASGRLMRKTAGRVMSATYTSRDGFQLRLGNLGMGGVIAVVVNKIFDVESDLTFEVIPAPEPRPDPLLDVPWRRLRASAFGR